jgi:quinol monooxygenase YgiN
MSNKSVYVIAKIVAQPDKIEELGEILLSLIEPTRKEEGCISYKLFRSNTDPAEFTFMEEWSGDDAINAHFATPYVQELSAKAPSLLAKEPEFTRYSLLG